MSTGLSAEQCAALFKSIARGNAGEENVNKATFVSRFPKPLQKLVSPWFFLISGIMMVNDDDETSVPWNLFAEKLTQLLREGTSWKSIYRDFDNIATTYIHESLGRTLAEWVMELSFWCTHQHLQPATTCEVTFEPGSVGMGADWIVGCITDVPDGTQASGKGVKLGWTMIFVDGSPYSEDLFDKKIAGSDPYIVTFQTPDPFTSALEAAKCSNAGSTSDWSEYNVPCIAQSIGATIGQCLLGMPCAERVPEVDSRILDVSLRFILMSMNAKLWTSLFWDPLYRDWSDGRSFHTLMKNVQHYRGCALIIIRGAGGEIIGAVSDYWEDGMGQFGGSAECFLVSLKPAIQACRAKDSCKNYAYINSKNKQKPMGLGFGGSIGSFRLWLDSDLTECKVSQMDTTYGDGKLYCGDAPCLILRISRLEIWGFGGDTARSAQLLQQKRDQDIREQARKVDRSLLVESQFDKEMFFGNTFAATADSREPTDLPREND